jgi:hypothetical protein
LNNNLKCNKAEFEGKGEDFGLYDCISVCYRETVLRPVCITEMFAGRRPFKRLMHRWKGIFKMYLGKWL